MTNRKRKCATCKHWLGTNEKKFAVCSHPLPAWADLVLNDKMHGTWGRTCRCWAERTAEDIDEIVEEWWSPKTSGE